MQAYCTRADPGPGQHTDEILLGEVCSREEVDTFRREEVIL